MIRSRVERCGEFLDSSLNIPISRSIGDALSAVFGGEIKRQGALPILGVRRLAKEGAVISRARSGDA
jgi:hypothetical protein